MSRDPAPSSAEAKAFAQRLRQALKEAGWPASSTVVAHQFNLRYWGRSISVQTAHNWLQGTSLPRQDKLRVLAEWLRVAPEALLLGAAPALPATRAASLAKRGETPPDALGLADERMLQIYLRLSSESRHTVQTVVAACEALDAARRASAPAAKRAKG